MKINGIAAATGWFAVVAEKRRSGITTDFWAVAVWALSDGVVVGLIDQGDGLINAEGDEAEGTFLAYCPEDMIGDKCWTKIARDRMEETDDADDEDEEEQADDEDEEEQADDEDEEEAPVGRVKC